VSHQKCGIVKSVNALVPALNATLVLFSTLTLVLAFVRNFLSFNVLKILNLILILVIVIAFFNALTILLLLKRNVIVTANILNVHLQKILTKSFVTVHAHLLNANLAGIKALKPANVNAI